MTFFYQLVCFEEKVELLQSLDRCRHAKTLMLAHYSKSIHTKLGILAHHDTTELQDNSESYCFGVMPLFDLNF